MVNGILDVVRGCLKEEMRMDTISSNLANSSVFGFKKDRISFQEVLVGVEERRRRGLRSEPADPALIRIKSDHTQGDFRKTGNTLDFAVHGKGFFKVDTPEGIRYTRRGNFILDGEGALTTQEGYRVLGGGGPITIQGGDISVDGQGIVFVDGSQAGQIELADFESYDGLFKAGNGMFLQTSDEPEIAPQPETRIEQGYIELSNVNIVEEMVGMIHSLRAFESYQKTIQVIDGLNQRAVNEVSRLR
jgi:flagellar basal-body rod protein FlgG